MSTHYLQLFITHIVGTQRNFLSVKCPFPGSRYTGIHMQSPVVKILYRENANLAMLPMKLFKILTLNSASSKMWVYYIVFMHIKMKG